MSDRCKECYTSKNDVKIWYAVTYSGIIREVHLCTPCKTKHETRLRRFKTRDEALIYKVTEALGHT